LFRLFVPEKSNTLREKYHKPISLYVHLLRYEHFEIGSVFSIPLQDAVDGIGRERLASCGMFRIGGRRSKCHQNYPDVKLINTESPDNMSKASAAKDVIVKLIVGAGQASPSPPVGPALGSKGVKSMDFCKVS